MLRCTVLCLLSPGAPLRCEGLTDSGKPAICSTTTPISHAYMSADRACASDCRAARQPSPVQRPRPTAARTASASAARRAWPTSPRRAQRCCSTAPSRTAHWWVDPLLWRAASAAAMPCCRLLPGMCAELMLEAWLEPCMHLFAGECVQQAAIATACTTPPPPLPAITAPVLLSHHLLHAAPAGPPEPSRQLPRHQGQQVVCHQVDQAARVQHLLSCAPWAARSIA